MRGSSLTAVSALRDGHGHDTSDGEKRLAIDTSGFQLPQQVTDLIYQNSDCSERFVQNQHMLDLAWITSSTRGRATRAFLFRALNPENGKFDLYTINVGWSTNESVGRIVCVVNSVYQNLRSSGLRASEIEWATNTPYGDEEGPFQLNLPGDRAGKYIERR